MSVLKEIEASVANLSETDYQKFKEWFWEYENEKWDKQIEKDITENKLDTLAAQALQQFKEGKFKPL